MYINFSITSGTKKVRCHLRNKKEEQIFIYKNNQQIFFTFEEFRKLILSLHC